MKQISRRPAKHPFPARRGPVRAHAGRRRGAPPSTRRAAQSADEGLAEIIFGQKSADAEDQLSPETWCAPADE